MAPDVRPSLWRPSLFAVGWHLATWGGLAGIGLALWSFDISDVPAMGPAFVVIAAMLVIGELRPIMTVGGTDAVPVSGAFVFAALYLWGADIAILLQALAVLTIEIAERKPLWKVTFNVGHYVLAVLAAAAVLSLSGTPGSPQDPRSIIEAVDLPVLVAAWAVYHLVDIALFATLSALTHQTFRESFVQDFWYYALSTAAVLSLSPLIVVVAAEAWALLPLLGLPLWAVYRTWTISREKEHAALHDALTDLPNRALFGRRLDDTVASVLRDDGSAAVFLLDLDRFKEVNDTLGHQVGDRLLDVVAARLRATVRPGDTVARLGGDEFAVLLPGVVTAGEAIEVARRLRAALADPVRLDGVMVEVAGAVGIALCPQHGRTPTELVRCADVAMYNAKQARTGVEIYRVARDPHSPSRLSSRARLRVALDADELLLHFQPKVDLVTGDVVGTEALLRWQDPERGLVPPDEFVPDAERSDLMPAVTRRVLELALARTAQWWRDGHRIPVAVNVTMRDLAGDDLIDVIHAELRAHDLPPEALMLEVTERVLVDDADLAVRTLSRLADMGVTCSLDDFGTGYSSLVTLQALPVVELKIDRSFVMALGSPVPAPAGAVQVPNLVPSIIGFAHGLDLTVVAEGVETAEQLDLLAALGCDVVQGFHLARPMPGDELDAWLAARTQPTIA